VYLKLKKNKAGCPFRSNLVILRLDSWSYKQSILDKLNKLNISKSPGPDGIHPRVLFELSYELLEPLYILFESSYKLGKLPDEWKLGHVTAVYKKGNKGNPFNYRPISLTSIICKLMESIIRDHIMEFFFQNSYLVINSMVLLKEDPLFCNF